MKETVRHDLGNRFFGSPVQRYLKTKQTKIDQRLLYVYFSDLISFWVSVVATRSCILTQSAAMVVCSIVCFLEMRAGEGGNDQRKFRFRFRLNASNHRLNSRKVKTTYCRWRHLRKWTSSLDTYSPLSVNMRAARIMVKSRGICGRVSRWRIRFCLRCSTTTRGLL